MRVLVVQNFRDTGLGQVGPALAAAGVAVELRRPDLGEPLPAGPEGFAGLIVLGGAQDALDDAGSPYFPALLDLARQFEREDRAVLGICLGAQLLARAFGAENLLGAAKEFGWQTVRLTEAGAADPVTGALPREFPIFQWHDDTFALPVNAVRLAASEAAPVQAFRVGRAAYGVQFHLEADTALVRRWSETFAPYLSERQPGWAERRVRDEALFGADADRAGASLARAWTATLRSPDTSVAFAPRPAPESRGGGVRAWNPAVAGPRRPPVGGNAQRAGPLWAGRELKRNPFRAIGWVRIE